MNRSIDFEIDRILERLNQIHIGKTFEFEEDRTARIKKTMEQFGCLPFVKFFNAGMCEKIKEQQVVESYADYIGKGKGQI